MKKRARTLSPVPLRQKYGRKTTHGAKNIGGAMVLLCRSFYNHPDKMGDYHFLDSGIPTCRRCLDVMRKELES